MRTRRLNDTWFAIRWPFKSDPGWITRSMFPAFFFSITNTVVMSSVLVELTDMNTMLPFAYSDENAASHLHGYVCLIPSDFRLAWIRETRYVLWASNIYACSAILDCAVGFSGGRMPTLLPLSKLFLTWPNPMNTRYIYSNPLTFITAYYEAISRMQKQPCQEFNGTT